MLKQFSLPHLSSDRLQELSRDSRCLERDANGPKVLRLANQDILKLFYPRKTISWSRLFPPALRFAENARKLQALGIPSVTIKELWRLDDGVFGVLYSPIPGDSLRELVDADPAEEARLRRPLSEFIDSLHERGIYFRSLHLGNIIKMPDGRLGLIDIADLRCLNRPLRTNLIRRNRAHFEHYVAKERVPFDCSALWRLSRNA